jgi:hypothetical protein
MLAEFCELTRLTKEGRVQFPSEGFFHESRRRLSFPVVGAVAGRRPATTLLAIFADIGLTLTTASTREISVRAFRALLGSIVCLKPLLCACGLAKCRTRGPVCGWCVGSTHLSLRRGSLSLGFLRRSVYRRCRRIRYVRGLRGRRLDEFEGFRLSVR